MRNFKLQSGTSKNEQTLLLFDDASGVLIAVFYLLKNRVFKEPKGIWLIDINSTFPLQKPSDSISRLMENVCVN